MQIILIIFVHLILISNAIIALTMPVLLLHHLNITTKRMQIWYDNNTTIKIEKKNDSTNVDTDNNIV